MTYIRRSLKYFLQITLIFVLIIGILMLICGVSCMCTPLVTFMDAGYFIVIMVAVYGVIGIVRAIAEKHFGAGFVFSILSVSAASSIERLISSTSRLERVWIFSFSSCCCARAFYSRV